MKLKDNLKGGRRLMQGFFPSADIAYIEMKQAQKLLSKKSHPFSARQLASLLPFNRKFDILFEDKLTTSYILANEEAHLLPIYFIKLLREGHEIFMPLERAGDRDFIGLLREEGILFAEPSKNGMFETVIRYGFHNEQYTIDSKEVSEEELTESLNSLPSDTVIRGTSPYKNCYRAAFINTTADIPELADVYAIHDGLEVSGCDVTDISASVRRHLTNIAAGFPEIEYMNFEISIGSSISDEFVIHRVDTGAELSARSSMSPLLANFIKAKLAMRRKPAYFLANLVDSSVTLVKYFSNRSSEKKGFSGYMERNWKQGLKEDAAYEGTNKQQKKWANERGFYSYRIEQYGLTDKNYGNFLSDYDYKWIRPINNSYRKLLWDKIKFYYSLTRFREHLPKYYFHLIPSDEGLLFAKMPDLPDDISGSAEGVCSFLKLKGKLAMKPTKGAHGDGFYKLEYVEGEFRINDKIFTESQFKDFLNKRNRYYLITEYASMHEDLQRIYDKVACTLRIMVINRNGNNPKIEDAYFRIGTSSGGFTDNISNAYKVGLHAPVNPETGSFGNAETLCNHKLSPIDKHPDSMVPIAGNMPNWDKVRSAVLDISKYLSPLEYLGFDVVITEDGLNILEINTHQELHKYPMYNEDVKSYLNHKLRLKKSGVKLC